MEGYLTNRDPVGTNSNTVSASTRSPTFDPLIFRSARDTNQAVFTSGSISPFPSPRKRGRIEYEDQPESADDTDDDVDVEMHDTDSIPPDFEPRSRLIKPLRKTRRPIIVDPFPMTSISDPPKPHVDGVSTNEDPFID